MNFRGDLTITGLQRPQNATSRQPVRFAPQGGVIFEPEQALKLFHSGKLNDENGSLIMRLMPLDWEGGNKDFQFFLHCRNRMDGSIVMLQKSTDGKLTFLIGTLKKFNKVTADIDYWKAGQWYTVQVNWTCEKLDIHIDGEAVGSAPRKYEKLDFDDTIDIGGKIFSPCKGQTAISYLMISPKNIPVKTDISVPDGSSAQSFVPSDNIASAEFQAVMLPSSQWNRDRSLSIEQTMDGNPDSYYLSGKDDGEHWVEIRWPQPVEINGVKALSRSPHDFSSYQVKAPDRNDWREILNIQSELEKLYTFQTLISDRIRIYFKDAGQLALRELYVTGKAPKLFLKPPTWPGFFIWYPEPSPNDVVRYFRRNFQVESTEQIALAKLQICCDDAYTLYLNGQYIGSGGFVPDLYDVEKFLKNGHNSIAVRAQEFTICEGLLAELTLIYKNGKSQRIYTDLSWLTSQSPDSGWNTTNFDDSKWPNAIRSLNLGEYASNIKYRYLGTDGPGFELKKLTADASVKPGQMIEIKTIFSCEKVAVENYGFRLELGEEALNPSADYSILTADTIPAIPTSEWEPGKNYEVKWKLTVPAWAPHGSFPLKIRALHNGSEALVTIPEQTLKVARFETEPLLNRTPVKSKLENRNGQLRMIVNGEIVAPPVYTINSFNSSFRLFGESAAIKAGFYRLQMMSDNIYPQKSADKEQFYRQKLAMIDQDIHNFLKVYPDAKILWGMTFRPEAAWSDEYPDEVAMFPDGTRTKNSFSSQVWLDMSAEWIQRMVVHMRQSDYAGYIAGFHFGIGDGAEAMYWGRGHNRFNTAREKVSAGDFSPAAMNNFRRWLRKRYNDDVQSLRHAWKKTDINFDTATPDMDELRRSEQQNFRNPATGTMSMDYWNFLSDSMADAAIFIAQAYKKACANELLVGVYGFYNLAQLHLIYTPASSHHVAYAGIEKVLNCREIDFLACIQSYAGVNGGTPVITGMPDSSLRKHGKLFLEEYDIRTFFTDLTFSHSHTTSQQETLNIIRRDFGHALVRDNQCWFYGFARGFAGRRAIGWYSEQSLIDELNRCHAIGKATGQYTNRSTAEVALFVNARDIATMDIMDAPGTLANTQYNTVYRELKKTAVPYDCFLLDDFKAENLAQYKVVIMLNTFYLTSAERQNIRQILEKQQKTVLWLYAPGYSDPTVGLSVDNISSLTGIKTEITPEFRETLVIRTNNGYEFGPYSYPHDKRKQQIGPVFHIDDPQAEILGTYEHNGKAAIARKNINGMTSIYCASPLAGQNFLEDVFRQSRIHFYSDKMMYMDASSRFLTIHATQDLNTNIKLPKTGWILNLYTGQIAARNKTEFPINLKRGESALFFMGTQVEINQIIRDLKKNENN